MFDSCERERSTSVSPPIAPSLDPDSERTLSYVPLACHANLFGRRRKRSARRMAVNETGAREERCAPDEDGSDASVVVVGLLENGCDVLRARATVAGEWEDGEARRGVGAHAADCVVVSLSGCSLLLCCRCHCP